MVRAREAPSRSAFVVAFAAAVAAFVCMTACRSTSGRAEIRADSVEVHSTHLRPTAGETFVVRGGGSQRIAPGYYDLQSPAEGLAGAAIHIVGARDLVLDLTGVEIAGAPEGVALDSLSGFGIVLTDCERVTIRGGKLSGYKVCVAALRSTEVVLEGVTFEGWFGQRLLSTPQTEHAGDWLRPHANDESEWMTNYGAAIALEDCDGVRITGCRGRRGQNGILLTRSNECVLTDNDFSFLSGWGLALYRSSFNRVAHCVFDYCVRGYSHDVYWRGQDSAGILVFERSSDNVFVENSATHGGDGVFLFGGRDTVEGLALARGEPDPGGSDRNVFYRNDFSYAVANSIEATFSNDNWVIENRLNGARQHGVWGGYSTRLVCLWNAIDDTRGGAISIEHGVDAALVGNQIEDADVGLELWWDPDPEFVDGPFGQRNDTSSRGTYVASNRFARNAKDFEITRTQDLVLHENVFVSKPFSLSMHDVVVSGDNPKKLEPRALVEGRDAGFPSGRMRDVSLRVPAPEEPEWLVRARNWRPPQFAGSLWKYAQPPDSNSGLATIVMGPYGPWDHRSGEPRPAQLKVGGLCAGVPWSALWFRWDEATDPRADLEAWRNLARTPLARAEVRSWTDPWGGSASVRAEVGLRRFGLIARGSVAIQAPGRHRLSVTSDDGVRISIDGERVLENWTWHGPTRDEREIELAGPRHDFVIEYFQIDGATALVVELVALEGP
ncbi:MAG: right-handed parallel beta-helix repeat-containing protein [Planctomycetes bacterium]|nr:right-handed parallel beta-helix repeat-containing protein [Planctomycetota bacterium]